ncbi:hypothetical protein B9Z41_03970 [Limnohabitans sp. JirII-31]|nr:hypothetical protein B9Z41_03970 [Limnohabitans sp. JirII-31]
MAATLDVAAFFATGLTVTTFLATALGAAAFLTTDALGLALGVTDLTGFAAALAGTGFFTIFFATALGVAPVLPAFLAGAGFLEAGLRAWAFTVCLLAGRCRT